MEQKLKEFKSRRRREIILNKSKEFFQRFLEKFKFNTNLPTDNSNITSPLIDVNPNTTEVSVIFLLLFINVTMNLSPLK